MNRTTVQHAILCLTLIVIQAGLTSFTASEAATITASSCSFSDVSAAVETAAYGDTVLVPSGTCTWSNTLTITKGINLIGAGIGNTIINNAKLRYEPEDYDTDYAFRLSGFTFNAAADADRYTPILHLGYGRSRPTAIGNRKQTKVRIDHNRFHSNSRGVLIWLHQGMFGVIDNNELYSDLYAFRATHNSGDGPWKYWGYYPGMAAVEEFGQADNIYN